MKRTIIAGAAAIVAVGLIGAATPASAAPAKAPTNDINLPKHVTWHVQDQDPPLLTLLRVYVPVKTNYTPQEFSGLVTLQIFKRVMTRRGLQWEPRRAKGAPAAHLSLADLAAPGGTVTWKFGGTPVYPDWYCKKPGRYFIAMSLHFVTDTGQREHWLFYEPHLKGAPHSGAFGTLPPDYAEGMRIKC